MAEGISNGGEGDEDFVICWNEPVFHDRSGIVFHDGKPTLRSCSEGDEDGDAKRRDEPAESHICRWLFLVHGV